MSDPFGDRPFPRPPLLGAAALVLAALLSVALVRTTGFGVSHEPVPASAVVRDLRFEDRPDGAIAVYDANADAPVQMVAPGTNGFIRGALRGLARERKRQGLGPDLPFRLSRTVDDRLLLEDPATGRVVDLGAFGPTNAAAFARLLASGQTP